MIFTPAASSARAAGVDPVAEPAASPKTRAVAVRRPSETEEDDDEDDDEASSLSSTICDEPAEARTGAKTPVRRVDDPL